MKDELGDTLPRGKVSLGTRLVLEHKISKGGDILPRGEVSPGTRYHVEYWIQTAAAVYLSLYFFISLCLQLSNIKTFLRNCEAWKVETWYKRGQWADVTCIPESGCCCLFIPLLYPWYDDTEYIGGIYFLSFQ